MKRTLSVAQLIILSFFTLILVGTVLLCLPISTVQGETTTFVNALFTATSASCVTGLIAYDTATHFTLFGKIVIIILIQIGGLGVLTISLFFIMLAGRNITLKQREIIQNCLAAPNIGGIVKLLRYLFKRVILIEIMGTLILSIVFINDFGPKGLLISLFHSISAFCNAGFDLMGSVSKFSSLTTYGTNPIIIITISLLIIIGGLGFFTWNDISSYHLNFKKYSTQSKIVLTTTLILLVGGFSFYFFLDFVNLPLKERIYYSFFQSVTTRTAGFNNFDLNLMSENGKVISIILMLIGGAPGSTAGGMKVVTIALVVLIATNYFRHERETVVFKRSIDDESIRNAVSIFTLYLILFSISGLIIARIEGLPLLDCLFETASAIGTVGLTLGITQSLGIVSKIILILLMFIGRVGGITLIFATNNKITNNYFSYPKDKLSL